MIISYNFGHSCPELGSEPMGYSQFFTCKVFRQFADEVRDPIAIRGMMDFADRHYIPKSSMTIFININNEHRFPIKMINVREYKRAIEEFIKTLPK